jgi:hypothetical protein
MVAQGMTELEPSYAGITKLYLKYRGLPPVRDPEELRRSRTRRSVPGITLLTPDNLSKVPGDVDAGKYLQGSVLAIYGEEAAPRRTWSYPHNDVDTPRLGSRNSSRHRYGQRSQPTINAPDDTFENRQPRRHRPATPPPPPRRAERYPRYAPPPPVAASFHHAVAPKHFAPLYLQHPYPLEPGYLGPHNVMGYGQAMGDFPVWRSPWGYQSNGGWYF